MGRISADIAFESWFSEFGPCPRFDHLPYLGIAVLKLAVLISSLFEIWLFTLLPP